MIRGRLVRRYKRFLADVELENGSIVTAHCPNSGSMKTCIAPGWEVKLSESDNPKRKTPYTLERTFNGSSWIVVNTQLANAVVFSALKNKELPAFASYDKVLPETTYKPGCRFDFFLAPDCYIEVKSVTLLGEDGNYQFPDSVTLRGQKHLDHLIDVTREGKRAALIFIILRQDGENFRPADDIDPVYGEKLRKAKDAGVEIYAFGTEILQEVRITRAVDIDLLYR